MSAEIIEAPSGEGGDDRRQAVAASRMAELLGTRYPELDETELQEFLEAAAEKEPNRTVDEVAEQLPPAPATGETGRAIYGHEPNSQQVGNVALAATVQSHGFAPAGLHGAPGDQTARFMPRFQKRPSRYPKINGVY